MSPTGVHQQFLILAVYPALARLPKNILPTLGIYSGTVRNRFGPLDTVRNCLYHWALVRECSLPSGNALYQHIPVWHWYIVPGILYMVISTFYVNFYFNVVLSSTTILPVNPVDGRRDIVSLVVHQKMLKRITSDREGLFLAIVLSQLKLRRHVPRS